MTCQLDRRLERVTDFIGDETGRGTERVSLRAVESPDHTMGRARQEGHDAAACHAITRHEKL